MSHYSSDKWLQFIGHKLDAVQYKMMENHLYQCDECLELYTELIENEIAENVVSASDAFIEEVIQKVITQDPGKKNAVLSAQISYQKLTFLYSIAAVITIILYASGIFQIFTDALTSSTSVVCKIPSIANAIKDYDLFQKLNFILTNGG